MHCPSVIIQYGLSILDSSGLLSYGDNDCLFNWPVTRRISTSYLQMAASYNSREVNFFNPVANVSRDGYAWTESG